MEIITTICEVVVALGVIGGAVFWAGQVNQKLDSACGTLEKILHALEKHEKRIDRHEARIEEHEHRLERLERK